MSRPLPSLDSSLAGADSSAEGCLLDWDGLVRQHGGWLKSVIRARCDQPSEVDELFQEVVVAAMAGSAALRSAESLGPWLYRIALRHCLLHRRRLGRQRRRWTEIVRRWQSADGVGGRAESAGDQLDPLGWLLAQERHELVRGAVQQLPERDAEILLLKYGDNWSCRQLSDHLGIGLAAVEARLHRARDRLRRALRQAVDGDSNSTFS